MKKIKLKWRKMRRILGLGGIVACGTLLVVLIVGGAGIGYLMTQQRPDKINEHIQVVVPPAEKTESNPEKPTETIDPPKEDIPKKKEVPHADSEPIVVPEESQKLEEAYSTANVIAGETNLPNMEQSRSTEVLQREPASSYTQKDLQTAQEIAQEYVDAGYDVQIILADGTPIRSKEPELTQAPPSQEVRGYDVCDHSIGHIEPATVNNSLVSGSGAGEITELTETGGSVSFE